MSELHLDSLEIKNFRCFEHLTIEKLGRVNLIVGKNSVGKTALLEALWLFRSNGFWPVIHKILYDRNELVIYNLPASSATAVQKEGIKSFITNNYDKEPQEFEISSGGTAFRIQLPPFTNYLVIETVGHNKDKHPVVSMQGKAAYPDLPQEEYLHYDVIDCSKKSKAVFIPLKGLSWQAASTYWDDIALSNKEEAIVSCLQLLDPLATRFTFKGENMKDRVRYAVLKTGRFPNPVPLAKMGEGIQRIFAIALAMTTASDGYLLVDEIETGFYHRTLPDVWRAIFKLAHEWNIQVFATTHSWDCVKAFQQAAAEDQNEEAMLIRLARKKNGQIKAVPYTEEELTIAVEENIEVR